MYNKDEDNTNLNSTESQHRLLVSTFHMNLSSVPKLQDLPTIMCTLHKETGTEIK